MLPCRTRSGISAGITNFPLPIPSAQIPYDGFAVTPMNEPVDVSNCVKWPNSPECGGSYFDPCGIPPSFWVETKCNMDGICCTYSFSTFLGYSPPPVITCYRLYGTPPKPPKPYDQPPLPDIPDIPDIPEGCVLSVTFGVGQSYDSSRDIWVSIGIDKEYLDKVDRAMTDRFSNSSDYYVGNGIDLYVRSLLGSTLYQFVILNREQAKLSEAGADIVHGITVNYRKSKPGEPSTIDNVYASRNILVSLRPANTPQFLPWAVIDLHLFCPNGDSNYPLQPPSNPPPQPLGDTPMPCCEESNQLLREVLKRLGNPSAYAIPQSVAGKLIKTPTITEIAYELPRLIAERMGTGQFPVEIPATLLSDDGKSQQIKLESLTEFVGWFVQQVDALVGQFPVKIEIEDTDAIKEGDQKKEISLPNLAEAIAELYGLSFQSTYNSTLIVDLVLRNISEAIKVGNMGVETLDYAKAVAKYLGFKGNKVERKIPYFVDPRETQDLDKYRKEVELVTQGFEYEDKQTMAEQMKMVLFAVSIIKAAFLEEWNPKRKYEAGKGIRKDAEGDDKAWEEHLAAMRNPQSTLRQDDDPPIKIREIPKPKK